MSEIAYWSEMRKSTKKINPTEILHRTFFSYIAGEQINRAILFYRTESRKFEVDDNLRDIEKYISSRRTHTSSGIFEI